MTEDTECGAQGTPRCRTQDHSYNRILPHVSSPDVKWNISAGSVPYTSSKADPHRCCDGDYICPSNDHRWNRCYGDGSRCPSNDHTSLSSTSSSLTATSRGPAEQPARTSLDLTVPFFTGSAKQSAHTSTTRPIRRSNGPAKQTVASFLFPSTRPSRQPTYTYNSTSTAISAAGLHHSPRRSSRLAPSLPWGGDKDISLSALHDPTHSSYASAILQAW